MCNSLAQAVRDDAISQQRKNVASKIWGTVFTWQTQPPDRAAERWVGELFQNAIDTATINKQNLEIAIRLTRDSLSFAHNGGPFTVHDLSALILAGTAKPADRRHGGTEGLFGTGFFVTHAISRRVAVSGVACRPGQSSDFRIELDRQGTQEQIEANIEKCYLELGNEIRRTEERVSARFEYLDLDNRGHEIARTGLQHLDEILPYLFAFNGCLRKVTVNCQGEPEVAWERGEEKQVTVTLPRELGSDAAGTMTIRVLSLGMNQESGTRSVLLAPYSENAMAAALLLEKPERRLKLPEAGTPHVFRFFPLANSGNIGIPVVIHAEFDVGEDRSILCLAGEKCPDRNQELAKAITSQLAPFLGYLSTLPGGGPAAVKVCSPTGALSNANWWRRLLQNLPSRLAQLEIVHCEGATVKAAKECNFPVARIRGTNFVLDAVRFRDLVAAYSVNVPVAEDSHAWEDAIGGWDSLDAALPAVWYLNDVLEFLRGIETVSSLEQRLETNRSASEAEPTAAQRWLRELLSLMTPFAAELPTNLLDTVRLPNQNGAFKDRSLLCRDRDVDSELKDIAGALQRFLTNELLATYLEPSESDASGESLIKVLVNDEIDNKAVVHTILQHVRECVREREAGREDYRWKQQDPLIEGSARLTVWLAKHEECVPFAQAVEDLRLLTADNRTLAPNSKKFRCLLPVASWPNDRQRFSNLFPGKRRLADIYYRVAGNDWETLKKCLIGAKITCPQFKGHYPDKKIARGEDIKKYLLRSADVQSAIAISIPNCSTIFFLDDVIPHVRDSDKPDMATLLLSFLMKVVAHEDERWQDVVTIALDSGRSIEVRPCEWTARILHDSWLPRTEIAGDQRKDVFRKLVDWNEVTEDAKERAFLQLLGFDQFEVQLECQSKGNEEEKERLRQLAVESIKKEEEKSKDAEAERQAIDHYMTANIDEVYLPFTGKELLKHFAPAVGDDPMRHLRYYVRSAKTYAEFGLRPGNPARLGRPLSELKKPCQIEKDERFWVAACLMAYYYASDRNAGFADLMKRAFALGVPIPDFSCWEDCFGVSDHDKLHLFFEAGLPSPRKYKAALRNRIRRQNFIPYVRDAATDADGAPRRELEKRTRADAVLLNEENGFSVLFEAKVLSDCSVSTEYDVARNQIARSIDVMLTANNKRPPLNTRRADRTLFVLITPRVFQVQEQSRLYGHLLHRYRRDPQALARELPHRDVADWQSVANRLGWLTWDDCNEVLAHSCRWLDE